MSQDSSKEKSFPRTLLVALLVFLLALLSQALTFYLIPNGQLNDDALFLLRSLKLARPEDFPALHNPTHYAVGWPLFLAPFLWLSEDFYTVGRLVAMVLTGLTAVFLFLLFKGKERALFLPLAGVLLFLNSQQILRLGSSLMSEPLTLCLTVACLFFSVRATRWWHFALLGLAGAWGLATRSESLAFVLVIAFALWRRGSKFAHLCSYGLAFVTSFALLRSFLEARNAKGHLGAVLEFFQGKPGGGAWDYPWVFLKSNSLISLSSVFGSSSPALALLWLLPLAAILYALKNRGPKTCLVEISRNPLALWLILFPMVLFIWPYFNARYWVLWLVLLLVSTCKVLPPKVQMVVLSLLLMVQAPGAFSEYRLGPVAQRFQTEIYLPYYQSLSQAKKVMTLNAARVETIALVPTVEPIPRTDFQSIPIAMAHLGADVVEWETSNRHIVTYDGTEVRPFPPQALEALRKSTLFEPYQSSAFSESFRLLTDSEALKQAGNKYSQAMQSTDLASQISLLEEALALVPDLPETRLAYLQARLARNPQDSEAKRQLEELLSQYPYLAKAGSP